MASLQCHLHGPLMLMLALHTVVTWQTQGNRHSRGWMLDGVMYVLQSHLLGPAPWLGGPVAPGLCITLCECGLLMLFLTRGGGREG